MTTYQKTLMILVVKPYRSGTNDDPELIQKNVDAMNKVGLDYSIEV